MTHLVFAVATMTKASLRGALIENNIYFFVKREEIINKLFQEFNGKDQILNKQDIQFLTLAFAIDTSSKFLIL